MNNFRFPGDLIQEVWVGFENLTSFFLVLTRGHIYSSQRERRGVGVGGREREGHRCERETEKHGCERETPIGCLSDAP